MRFKDLGQNDIIKRTSAEKRKGLKSELWTSGMLTRPGNEGDPVQVVKDR